MAEPSDERERSETSGAGDEAEAENPLAVSSPQTGSSFGRVSEPPAPVDPASIRTVERDSKIPRSLLIYGFVVLMVLLAGGVAIWALVEKRRLSDALAPDPLPKPILVTDRPESEDIAAWVRLLTEASFSPVVVPAAQYRHAEGGVTVLVDAEQPVDPLPSSSLVVVGRIPSWLEESLGTRSIEFTSDEEFAPTPNASPVLARVETEQAFRHSERPGWTIEENPTMNVDARWRGSSRPAVAHWTSGERRVVWFGFDPRHLWQRQNRQLQIMVRAAFRWVDGQPVSEGAVGTENAARGLEPAARTAARAGRLAFSVDRTRWPEVLSVRVRNGGDDVLENPSIRIWLPPEITKAELRGSFFQTRYVSLVQADDSVMVTLPSLAPGSERLFALDTSR